ncbi:glycosyltransferase family 2 protein [Accumulibacter sp.]|uniref:glycosyltransferase family 2 protein n=1 Tax=Accumulibacter sp. TaxID=2053492 RepID=UPI0025EDE8DA|nr:glycosyltransferase family 2 protein [Accumulibacter sp.]MCM8624868.1 glycosyltransferase [Accumulibacter sp.]
MGIDAGVRISVVTATWNCGPTIEDCLLSVVRQTWLNTEHIVIDGGSQDSTLEVIQRHCKHVGVLVSEPDTGIYDALNKGIAHATGDVVGFLHSDDMYASPNVLAHLAAGFQDPSVCAVYGDLQYVRRDDVEQVVRQWVSSPFTRRQLEWGWMPPHPTLYVRREWYMRIGGFDTSYRIAADYHSILKLFSQPDFKAVYLPEVLVRMRMGGASNRSVRNVIRKSWEDWDALRKTGVGALGGLGALAWKNLRKLPQFRT